MPPNLAPYVTLPYFFLVFAACGVVFAANAYRPLIRRGPLSIVAFFASWLTSELPLHQVAWQFVAALVFMWAGALAAWPGWFGLGVLLLSWISLLRLLSEARETDAIMERALVLALGPGYTSHIAPATLARLDTWPTLRGILRPFAFRRDEVERIHNISYGELGPRNLLDIYRPKAPGERRPVLLWVHGGGWIIGNKDQQGLPLMNHLVTLGWACVAINYRLSPRATFPDHIIDVKRAVAWVKANIARWGGDPDSIVIAGGSAGGHLASLAALTPNDAELQPGFEEADTSVRACVPFYGVFDFTNKDGLGRADMREFLERLVMKRKISSEREAFERASPLYRVNPGAPPFFVIHGENDVLAPVAQARLFVEALRATSRSPVVYAELPRTQHAFEVFISLRAMHAIRGVARFLESIRSEGAPR